MKKRQLIVLSLFFVMFWVIASLMTMLMSSAENIQQFLQYVSDYYSAYFYILPSIYLTVLYYILFSKTNGSFKRSLFEIITIVVNVTISYTFRKSGLFGRSIMELNPNLLCQFGIKIAIIVIVTTVMCILINIVAKYFEGLLRYLYRVRFTVTIFGYFVIKMVVDASDRLNYWASLWYVMSFKDGVSSRLLPGTFLSMFVKGDYITEKLIYNFVIITLFVLVFLVSVLLGEYLYQAQETERGACLFIALLYLTIPCNIEGLWTPENMGRVEIFVICNLLLSVILFNKAKKSLWKYFILSIGTLLCMACYQGYLFLYFPIMFTIMVCDIAQSEKKRKELTGTVIVCIITAIGFLFFQFFSTVHYESLEEMYLAICNRTDMEVLKEVLYYEYFGNVKIAWLDLYYPLIDDQHSETLRVYGFSCMCMLLPLIIVFVMFWKSVLRNAKMKSIATNQYFWYIFVDLLIVPQFFLTMDWGRWFIACISVQFFQLTYLYYKRDEGTIQFMRNINIFTKKWPFLSALILLYFAGISKMEAAIQMQDARRIVRVIKRVIDRFI